MAAASSSSGSSFTSSSLGRPPTYSRSYVSPVDSTWTPTSVVSTLSAPSTAGSVAPQASPRPLDLGPPGYQATMSGPQTQPFCSELCFKTPPTSAPSILAHGRLLVQNKDEFCGNAATTTRSLNITTVPSNIPSEIHPHTLHSRHRQYHDPTDIERYLTFPEPHRIRYISDQGVCIHDQYIHVRYEFTAVDASTRFQGDLRRKDMMAFFDVDVVWTNVHGRTDGFGKVKGIGAIQRLKMWRDRYTTFHSLSVLANKTDGQYREYDVHNFDGELRNRDDRANQVKLSVRGRRGSVPDEPPPRRFSFARGVRPRLRPSGGNFGQSSSDSSPSSLSSQPPIDIRYLSIQFSSRQDYRRFLETWLYAHSTDRDFQGVPFPPNHFELPSPQMPPGQLVELESPDGTRTLQPVAEPADPDDRG